MPSEDRRRAIFAALVAALDKARTLHEAKQQALAQSGAPWGIVERIEQEGIDDNWPRLDEPE
jgi:hypothetical protein